MPGPIFISPTAAGLPYTPYLTTAEYTGDPDAIDVSELVPGGTAIQNTDALFQKIIQASSFIDGFLHYIIAATIDTATKIAKVRSDGTMWISVDGFPITEIVSLSAGNFPSTMTPISPTAATDLWIDDNLMIIPVSYFSSQATTKFGAGARMFVKYTIVSGYPNTLLAANVSAGASSVQVKNALGIYPGTQLTIYDSGKSEVITVGSSYVGGVGQSSTTLPLLAGTTVQYAHLAGVSITSLPAIVKKAAILATSGFIKTRGGGELVMASLQSEVPSGTQGQEGGGLEDLSLAMSLLQNLRLAGIM